MGLLDKMATSNFGYVHDKINLRRMRDDHTLKGVKQFGLRTEKLTTFS